MSRLRPFSKRQKSTMSFLAAAMALYFALSMVRDLAAGAVTWPIYLPGIAAGAAVIILTQRAATREDDDAN